jgi:hypothetical protein
MFCRCGELCCKSRQTLDEIPLDHFGIGIHVVWIAGICKWAEGLSFPWTISDQQGASQAIFIPTTKTVVALRICVSQRLGTNRRHSRARQSNVGGLIVRLAYGLDGKETAPPRVSMQLKGRQMP